VILKDRARLPKTSFSDIIRAYRIPKDLHKKDIEVLHQFLFYLQMLQARPVVWVRYMRQAFEDDSCNRVRITFDRELSFKTVDAPVITTNGSGWQRIPMDFVILEIKFTNQYPAWLSDMVKIFDLKQTAMSKYVSSVKQSCFMGFCGPQCDIGG
jgi:SPX domain protein involved in polyphosphate accumulation